MDGRASYAAVLDGFEPPWTMRCVEIAQPGGPEVLRPAERPLPALREQDVLIRVDHAGVNRPDALQRAGAYPPPPDASDLPGLEVSGEIVALGEVREHVLGSRVMALTPGGGYAEYVRVAYGHTLRVPEGVPMDEAGAIPETLFTVWHNVVRLGRLSEGDVLLVHGGSSGIGTMAIKVARRLGARVIATAGTDEKCAACEALGATAVNYRERDFVQAVRDITGGHGADVILDMVGGDYVARNYRAAAMDGRVVQIATLGGAEATTNVSMLMTKRLVHTGSTLRPQTDVFKNALAAELRGFLATEPVRPVMDSTFALERAADAHRRMEAGDHIGKIVLKVRDG